MLLPGVRQTYLPLQWKIWTSLGFSHMDMILSADAKVNLKEREPRQAYLFLLSNSDQLSSPTSQEERVSWRKWDRKCYSGLAPSTRKLEAKKARFPTGFFQEISSGVSVICKLPEVRSHISSCPPLMIPNTVLNTETDAELRPLIDGWHFMSTYDISPTGWLQKEKKLLWFHPSHCQSLPNPTIWVWKAKLMTQSFLGEIPVLSFCPPSPFLGTALNPSEFLLDKPLPWGSVCLNLITGCQVAKVRDWILLKVSLRSTFSR